MKLYMLLENKYKDLIENNKIRLIPKAAFTSSDGANLFGLQEYQKSEIFKIPQPLMVI